MQRRTAGFRDDEITLIERYATAGTDDHDGLTDAVPEVTIESTSSAIRALVLAGHRSLGAQRLQRSYEAAVASGELDAEAAAWYRAVATTLADMWEAE